MKLGRNDPCHCGSGRKYKQCHLEKDEAAEREARAKAAAEPPAPASDAPAAAPPPRRPPPPYSRAHANKRGFARVSATRKVGGS
jgi:hypothetical protein